MKFSSVFDQRNSLMKEFSTSIASFWATISLLLHLIFVLISLILSFFVFIIIDAIIVIAWSRDRGPSPFGPFYWPKWRTPTLPYTTASEISTFLIPKAQERYPFRAEPWRPLCGVPPGIKSVISDLRNEHSYQMHTLACVQKLHFPSMVVQNLNEFIFTRSVRSV